MEGGSARNEAEKEDHLLQTRSSDNLPPANYGKQPQLCMLSLLFTERVTSFLTVMLILMISVPRSMGDIAKRQLLYERIQMEDHPSFEIFCTYQNRIDVVQRSIEVLLAIPFGMLADKKGVRLIACLSLTGLILGDVYMYTVPYFGKVFPLSSVYGATILSAIGGGTIVYNGLVMAIMAIATPGTSRAPFFFWARAIFSLSSFITSFVNVLTITSGSNEYTFTFPADQARSVVLISVCVQALGFVILFFMPLYTMGIENSMPETATAATIVPTRQAFRSDLASSLPQRCVLAGLAGLAIYGMGQIVFSRATVALFKAAMEQRSEIERVRTMERVNDIISLVLFIAVLPAVYLFLLREKRDAAAANIALVRGSTALLAVGALSLGISSMKWALNSSLSTEPSSVRYYYWIYNLLHIVASYDAPLRSVLTFIVPVSRFSVLFTSIEATRFLAASGGWEMFKYFSVLGHTGLLFLPLFIVGAFHAFAWLLQ